MCRLAADKYPHDSKSALVRAGQRSGAVGVWPYTARSRSHLHRTGRSAERRACVAWALVRTGLLFLTRRTGRRELYQNLFQSGDGGAPADEGATPSPAKRTELTAEGHNLSDATAQAMRFNFRRILGITICFSPVALAVWSLLTPPRETWWAALIPLALGASIASLNLYSSFIRSWIYRFRHHSLEGYRYVSGFPVIGTVLVTLGILAGLGSKPIAAVALLVLTVDTGGLPWFLVQTWRDKSLWNPAA